MLPGRIARHEGMGRDIPGAPVTVTVKPGTLMDRIAELEGLIEQASASLTTAASDWDQMFQENIDLKLDVERLRREHKAFREGAKQYRKEATWAIVTS